MGDLLEDDTELFKLLVEQLKLATSPFRIVLGDAVGDSDLKVLGQSKKHIFKNLLALDHPRLLVDHSQVFLDPWRREVFPRDRLQLK